MFGYQTSKHAHFDAACRAFALAHDLEDVAAAVGKDTPVYSAVPLPVPMAGSDSGMFQFPPEGTLVEIAFTGGRPDKPFVRQTVPDGTSLPDIQPANSCNSSVQKCRSASPRRVTG